jgi:general secretion pathway protein B
MSYILDALKKSEREKTLGQVPTLESVVSDGAKKQRSGTPWWLNLIVFVVTLLAVVGILKMAGLIDLSRFEKTVSQQSEPPEESLDNAVMNEPAAEPVVADPEAEISAELFTETELSAVTALEDQRSTTNVKQNQDAPLPEPAADIQAREVQAQPQIAEVLPDASFGNSPAGDSGQVGTVEDNNQQTEEEFAALLAEELAALTRAQQFEAQQKLEQANSGDDIAAEQQPQFEEVIHNDLRNISVNVVSYSSDARQRFVMLDLTIYKEGDQLANNAQVVEIIRTGAIVEYQNNRYLLKP